MANHEGTKERITESDIKEIQKEWENVPPHYRFEAGHFIPTINQLIAAWRAEKKAKEKVIDQMCVGHNETCPNDVFKWLIDESQPRWCDGVLMGELDCSHSPSSCWLGWAHDE